MEAHSVFVTGANRGIGLEFVRQIVRLQKPPRYVIATYRSRDSTEELEKIKDSSKDSMVYMVKMDVTKVNEIRAARKITQDLVGEQGLTLLINNAGVGAGQSFPKLTEENLQYHYKINTVGPIMVLQEFLPLLEKAASFNKRIPDLRMSVSRAAVLNISSLAGCITKAGENELDQSFPGYKISKAGLNMAMRVIAASVKEHGILVINMCPGYVKTDLTTGRGSLEPHESIQTMLETLPKLDEEHHGSFVDRLGNIYPF
ncbi:C-factor-like [Uloborus diversus]|uniref:C-factor-like n=1 Tax=Uloborus diversus TaxID=327109 RepID=UPI002409B4D0|nr:C-factor-like [Uloborus diversus]